MKEVLYSHYVKHDLPLYLMYREVALRETDKRWMKRNTVRFDITIIRPANLGGEFVKTKGHYHPENTLGIGYPELYEVLDGTAHFILQKKNLEDIVLIEAHKGDIVVIPPGYGHVTVNPTVHKILILANLVSSAFLSEYAFYEKMHGAAYYELEGEIFRKNTHYPVIPNLRRIKKQNSIIQKLGFGKNLYDFVGNGIIAQFLNNPEKFSDIF